MGGRQYTQRGRRGRLALRRAVLLTVLGALAGALFLCARPGDPGEPPRGPVAVRAHGATHATTARATTTHATKTTHATTTHASEQAVCVSPYDRPGCSPLAHVTPGVLPVPPPAVSVAGGGQPSPAADPAGAGRIRPPEPLARAPDLHALQVLRT
ncbi:hypothetical protein [Streptomyces sp. NPDC054849]